MDNLEDIRNLFIDVKIDHFKVFIENEDKIKNKELNIKALNYYKNLKSVKIFSIKGINIFIKLYKYELFNYIIKNLIILHMPILAKFYFKKLKKKVKNDSK